MSQVGFDWPAARPPLARLAHIRAVLAARMWLESDDAWAKGRAWWRCERRIRAHLPAAGRAHIPDAEIIWPSIPGSPSAGQTWALEVELTPKPAARTTQIIAGLLEASYDLTVYLCAPAALPVVRTAVARFPAGQRERILIRELPPAALMSNPS